MGAILILSSFVAVAEVGGALQARTLAALELEPILVPTVIFGRHPGLGPPGGGPVEDERFSALLDGVQASGAFERLEAVLTGYFATPGQVARAAAALAAVRAAAPGARLLVDPIMGDAGKGLYVKPDMAAALTATLVPMADILAPNAWELQRLTGHVMTTPHDTLTAARDLARPVLASSTPCGKGRIGTLWSDGQDAWLAHHRLGETAVSGAGDLLKALFVAALVQGADPVEALETAVGDVAERILGEAAEVVLEPLT